MSDFGKEIIQGLRHLNEVLIRGEPLIKHFRVTKMTRDADGIIRSVTFYPSGGKRVVVIPQAEGETT